MPMGVPRQEEGEVEAARLEGDKKPTRQKKRTPGPKTHQLGQMNRNTFLLLFVVVIVVVFTNKK